MKHDALVEKIGEMAFGAVSYDEKRALFHEIRAALAEAEQRERALVERLLRAECAIVCERKEGTCVAIHEPDREPCTGKNCAYMSKALAAHRTAEGEGRE